MSRAASPEQQARNDRVDAIVDLFVSGYTVDYACEQGVAGGWTRDEVLTVVKQRGWPLDGSGRLPLRMRRTPTRRTELRPRRRLVDSALPPKLEAIARYDETPRAAATPPPPRAPAEPETPVRPRQPATSPADVSVAVERFLAERTVPAPDDQYLTAPELRDAYEAWRAETDAPAVTPRWLGIVLTSKFRKKQAVTKINGTKPNCYYGVAWKQATPPASTALEAIMLEEARASVALDGETQVVGGAYPATEPRPPVAPADEPLADWERELLQGWVWNAATKSYEPRGEQNATESASVLVEKEDTGQVNDPSRVAVDILALGLAHAHPAVRAKAKRVQSAVDDLCSALTRHRGAAS